MSKLPLNQIPLFSALPEAEVESLVGELSQLELAANKIMIREGEKGDFFYVLLEGEVEIVKGLGTRDEHTLDTHGPGDFVGEMSLLLHDGLRTASVRTLSPVRALKVTEDSFTEMLIKKPALAYEMVRELGDRLRSTDNKLISQLTDKNRALTQAYEELKAAQAELFKKERLEHELSMARNIQLSILPQVLSTPAGWEVGAKMVAARAVGGDFFDVIRLGPETVAVSIGDVSDKGVPAALFMAQFCSLLRAEARRAESPVEVLRFVNRNLLEMNQTGMFVTAIYGVLDGRSGEFWFARAGHEIPLMFSESGEVKTVEHGRGMPLCLFPDPEIDEQRIRLHPKEMLFLYTDGGVDGINADQQFFGQDKLQDTVRKNLHASAQELCDRVVDEVIHFQQEDNQFDDVTIVALRPR